MTITLRADTLTLRPWAPDDLESLVDIYRDQGIRRSTSLPVENADDARRWLAVQQQGWETGDRLSFAVHDDRHGLAGYVALKKLAEVGYWTAAHARGQGVAPRALNALTIWAFDTYTLDRIDLLHQADNVASCRVAEKVHYRLDRIMPAHPPAYPQDGHLHTRLA